MKKDKIFIAGHNGMVGSAIFRCLKQNGYENLITAERQVLDLTNQQAVFNFIDQQKPDYIIIAAAKVGGIQANNTLRAEFLYQNLMIQTNLIHGAWLAGVQRLLFIGSNCSYPRESIQPMREDYLLTGPLEPTNEPYAIAKIAGLKMCESYNRQYGTEYTSMVPCSLFGPHDNFDPMNSHVIPGLIRKFHEAKVQQKNEVELWGTGTPRREIMYVDDVAHASFFLMNHPIKEHFVNIGSGLDYTIRELAEMVAKVVGFTGQLVFDTTKPDGMPRKLLDNQKISDLGWCPQVSIEDGLKRTYQYFQEKFVLELV